MACEKVILICLLIVYTGSRQMDHNNGTMDLELKSHSKHPGINKQLFQLKTSRKDGLILQVHHTIPGVSGEVHRVRFLQVTFDETGELVAATDHRGNIFVIDLASRKFWMLPHVGSSSVIAFPPRKKNVLLIGTTSCTIHFINTEIGSLVGSLVGHRMPPKKATFSSKGNFCLTSSSQEAIVWNLESNTQAHRLILKKDILVKHVVFMPVTDNILTVFQDDAMHIWNFENFECVKQILPEAWKSHHIKTIAFTRDGRGMIIGGHTPLLVVFSLDAWCVKKVIELPDNVSGVRHIEFLPQLFDGGANKILGLLSSHCILYFMNIETSTLLKNVFFSQSNINRFSCSSNGKYIACILQSGEVNLYTTSQLLETRSPDEAVTIERADTAHSPDVPEADSSKKVAAQHKNKELLKQNLLKVHKQIKETLDLSRLQPILKEFGEYPECYRSLIWKTILQLPSNQASYVSLVRRDMHPAFINLEEEYPLENRTALKNLKRLLSCMTHWSPVFAEAKFLPLFVFPFVKVFQNDPFICFEAVVTIVLNWCQHWFEYFPYPPINVLSMIENVLTVHDLELLKFYYQSGVKSQLYAWTLLETAFSEVLSRSEWLCLWDHIISNEPAFLLMAVVAYNTLCRKAIMSCRTTADFDYFFHNQNPIDMKRLLSKTYTLCEKTSEEVHPRQYLGTYKPLEKGLYPVFNQYPKSIVDYKTQHLEKLRKEEESIKKDIQTTLNQKAAQEKRLKEEKRTELQEKRLRELEDTYWEMLAKEETGITEHQKKLLKLRKEVQALEAELVKTTRNRLMKQNVQQRHETLDLLFQVIERKRTLQETELMALEEEVKNHLKDVSAHEYNLEQKEGATHNSIPKSSMNYHEQRQEPTEEFRKKPTMDNWSLRSTGHKEPAIFPMSRFRNGIAMWDQDPVDDVLEVRKQLLSDSSKMWY